MSSTPKRAEENPKVLLPVDEHVSTTVRVAGSAGEFRLVAVRAIARGERLFRIEGIKTRRPSRYSVQIGEDLHIDLGPGHSHGEILERYFWRFMNHACEPNAWIRDREVVALHSIQPMEDVTFDYNSTEYDMAEPFACHCGSRICHGTIRGFRHLSQARRQLLRPYLAAHLLRHLEPTEKPDTDSAAIPVPA